MVHRKDFSRPDVRRGHLDWRGRCARRSERAAMSSSRSSQAPPSLDAQVTSAQAARNITLHIYETLYARDENAKPVPELAEGVKISEDGKTYVFPIRKGVKFHNGKDLDANDVVASLERYRKVGASASLLAAIDKVKASGPSEVTITSEGRPVDLPRESLVALARRSRSIRRRRLQRPPTRSTISARAHSGSSSTSPTATSRSPASTATCRTRKGPAGTASLARRKC